MEEIIFVGIDMAKEVKKLLKEQESAICNGMTDNERKAYEYGVNNFASILEALLEYDEEYAVPIHINGLDMPEEFTYEDLSAKILG